MSLFLAAFHNGLDIIFQFVVSDVKNLKVLVYLEISVTFYDPPRFFLRPTDESRVATHSLGNAELTLLRFVV